MKQLLVTLCAVIFCAELWSQNIGINVDGSAPAPSALLDINGDALPNNGKRGLLIPRVTTTQRDLMLTAEGLLVYNTTTSCFNYWSIGSWHDLCGGSEKPRMIGYGGGVGSASRTVPTNSFHDIEARIVYEQANLFVELVGVNIQYRLLTNDWASAGYPRSVVVLDDYLYLLIVSQVLSPLEWRVYRYDVNNLALGGTQMNFIGLPLVATDNLLQMTSSSAGVFYFTYNAGNSNNDFAVAKYDLAGTMLSHTSTVTFGSEPNSFDRIMVDGDDNVYGIKTPATDDFVRKFNSSGALIYVTSPYLLVGSGTPPKVLNWDGAYYFGSSAVDFILNRVYLE